MATKKVEKSTTHKIETLYVAIGRASDGDLIWSMDTNKNFAIEDCAYDGNEKVFVVVEIPVEKKSTKKSEIKTIKLETIKNV